MLIGLLSLLLLTPIMARYLPDGAGRGIQIAFMLIMFIGVWSLQSDKRLFSIGITLTAFDIIISAINFFLQSAQLQLLSLVLVLLFCILSAVIAMRQILFKGKVSTNKLVGSICIYLLIGIIWAFFYFFIDLLNMGAFEGLEAHKGHGAIWEYIYFSFVTLTTLGYGDISPVNEVARTMVFLEAICGQFYLAILVASLVGAHMVEHVSSIRNK